MRDGWKIAAWTAGAGALAAAGGAAAHHSYAMFDRTKTITITGKLLTWEMVNPHSFMWVIVQPVGGKEQTWGLEGGGIAALTRAGVTKSAVKPGEKVVVDLHPLRDGRTGGQLVKLTLPDGREVKVGGGGDGTARTAAP
jgi:hypothetical protein